MRLGRYEVTGTLGQGAAGIVYRARSDDGRDVALKVLHRTSDPGALARFEREARLIASFGRADGFVPVLDAGNLEDSRRGQAIYIAFELLTGGTLRDRLSRGALPVDDACVLVAKLARAIARAHERGIVHRDLKPENVLFAADGTPLVADLGLAKHFRDDVLGASRSVSLSHAGELRGTAGYMAPEQMLDARSVGPSADVFSLGAILHECLAGRPAFEAPTVLELLTVVEKGRPAPLRSLRPDVPAWLERVVNRALASEPAARFSSAHELARALEAGDRSSVSGRVARGALAALAIVGVGVALLALRSPSPAKVAPPVAPAARPRSGGPAKAPPSRGTGRDDRLEIERVQATPEVRAILERARAATERGDLRGAELELDRALELVPSSAAIFCMRGATRGQQGDPRGALEDYDRSIALDPDDGHAHSNRGVVRELLGDRAGALADLDRAIALEPGYATAFFNRGWVRGNAGRVDEALADLDRAIALDPKMLDPLLNKSVLLERRGDQEGALAALDRAIEVDPKGHEAFMNRTALLTRCGRSDEALADANRAVELAPARGDAWATRATVRLAKGDLDGALGDVKHALALDPKLVVAQRTLAEVHVSRGDLDAALAAAERAVELGPRDPESWGCRGRVHSRRDERDASIADYDKALELAPGTAVYWANRAAEKGRAGRHDDAIVDLGHALELEPGEAGFWVNRAVAHGFAGHADQAIADATRALELDPKFAQAYWARAMAREKVEVARAVADYERFLELAPGSPLATRVRERIDALRAKR